MSRNFQVKSISISIGINSTGPVITRYRIDTKICSIVHPYTAGSSVGGALKAGMQSSREEEGGTWELYHSNILAKSTFCWNLQTAALSKYDQINEKSVASASQMWMISISLLVFLWK